MRKLTHEEFLNNLKNINDNFKNGNLILVSEFKGTEYPLTIKCTLCGQEWTTNRAMNILSKSSHCKFCNCGIKFTREEFESKLKEINPNFKNGKLVLTSSYLGLNKSISVKCANCEREWTLTSASNILTQTFNCRFCSHGNKISHDRFLSRFKQINENFKEGKLILTSTYLGMNEPITIKCNSCESEWTIQAKGLLKDNYHCTFCHHGNKITHEKFLNKLKQINENFKKGKLILASNYCSLNKQITVKCTNCEQEWTEKEAQNLLRKKYDCKFCSSKNHT